MAIRFQNFDYSYLRNGKHVFAPSLLGRTIGYDLKNKVESAALFDDLYFHLRPGGHIVALHEHRDNRYFARLDIERFFYNIGRNRIGRCLREIGIGRAEHYAKWSTVKNPYQTPSYALPYGFVQSPIVATLVLMLSEAGALLRV